MLAASSLDAPALTSVVVAPTSPAALHYRTGRENAVRAPGFPAGPGLDLHFFGGKTMQHMTFTNVYLGGASAWQPDDIAAIDRSLAGAIEDTRLNNVLAQYFPGNTATAAFQPSRVLPDPCPGTVYRDTIETLVGSLDAENGLSGFDLGTSVFCFMLPRGVVLVDGTSAGHVRRYDEHDDARVPEVGEQVDSKHGLGGYHGSIHARRGGSTDTVYYAVGVYSEGGNGIVAFDEPWKNVCATFYHELCEARTDPDVEDAVRAGNDPKADSFLGWYSPRGGEIGDIPIEQAGADLGSVMKEVPLARGGTAPIQLMWSNAVHGPEGPITRKHKHA